MKLKFKIQQFQTHAVEAVADCFIGQANSVGNKYTIDMGRIPKDQMDFYNANGFSNPRLSIDANSLLQNIQTVQRKQNIPVSPMLFKTKITDINLDVEMETGTGKTYCYIKTIFELNKRYGWSKFIIVVPSIAIREGVNKAFEITDSHFLESYGKKARYFIYNSKQLHNLEAFSSDAGINVMIINVQAFNATGKDARRIYEELDDFQSRRPIDVISANNPILILDEPQKMEGDKTLDSLKRFNPLMILRYSATHKSTHNKVYRLDALDAYNQKLVKKISVRGITVKGLPGTNSYLYLESIEISRQNPVARIEMEIQQNHNIKRVIRKIGRGDNLFELSGEMNEYKGFVVSEVNAITDTVSFTNGIQITAGEAIGDMNELVLRRIQIREAIRAHLEKEQVLFHQGIKVLTLFFIDEVAKYRKYNDSAEESGEYAQIFEEEYLDCISDLGLLLTPLYKQYLENIPVNKTHNGYFSIDKKTKRLIDPETGKKSSETDDVDAYDLILKDKERLLSFNEPTRFIFSHSALREGWDNPNVFVICALKHSDNTVSRRQEVGRGLRLSVNQLGERIDNPAIVHQINVLTVVASESYKDFVSALQKDIVETLSERSRKADEKYFTDKVIKSTEGDVTITQLMAKQIYRYLAKNEYTDDYDQITENYYEAKKTGTVAELPIELAPYKEQIFLLIDSVFSDSLLPQIENGRSTKANPLNQNFDKKEFQKLWQNINQKAIYAVNFDSDELIKKSIETIDKNLKVQPLQYFVQRGEQAETIEYDDLREGNSFLMKESQTLQNKNTIHSTVRYDLVASVADKVRLTRKTVAEILKGINPVVFGQFKSNPESFITEISKLIVAQKSTTVIEKLTYDLINQKYTNDIFTDNQANQDFTKAGKELKKHIYDYAITDSKIERGLLDELEASSEVIVYAKLPKGFFIPTPLGNYSPDWAIAFEEAKVKHIYFVAETKGNLESLQLREIENGKIECARKFFAKLNEKLAPENVKYDAIDSYKKLMVIVGVVNTIS